ncbi:MAG: DUF429 domain-containing protein [Microcoleaceae cyanobacterium]
MQYLGLDGCRSGWFYIGLNLDQTWCFGTLNTFAEIQTLRHGQQQILVDIPIGLRDVNPTERLCDLEARKLLKPKRSSSIFPAPVRSVLEVQDYQQASQENYRCSGRKLSKQTWNILPKIREVDQYLQSRPGEETIRESHPEVCFWALNGQKIIEHSKKTELGLKQRLQVLSKYCPDAAQIFATARQEYRKSQVADDDIVDALVCAVTSSQKSLVTLPLQPEMDSTGLVMEIVHTGLL